MKCFKCIHLRTNKSGTYSCNKNWFGGCKKPSKYGYNYCQERKDFEPIKNPQ